MVKQSEKNNRKVDEQQWKSVMTRMVKNSNFSVIMAFVVLSVFLSLVSPTFLTQTNITNLMIQTTVNFVLAAGVMVVIITGGTDLSVGRMAGLSGAVMAITIARTSNVGVGLVAGLIVGLVFGAFNGWIVSRMNIAPFIVTLGSQTMLQGLTLVVTNSRPISGFPPLINWIGSGSIARIPVLVIIAITVYGVLAFILRFTRFGRVLYGIGGNEEATRLSGINVRNNKLMAFVWAGLMAGIAGIMLTARLNSAQPTAGANYELEAIAASVIGGTSFSGGVGTATGTLFGALLLSTIRNGMNLLSIPTNWQYVVIGLVIIGAVFLDIIRSRKQ